LQIKFQYVFVEHNIRASAIETAKFQTEVQHTKVVVLDFEIEDLLAEWGPSFIHKRYEFYVIYVFYVVAIQRVVK